MKFVLNRDGFRALALGPQVRAMVLAEAERAKVYARSISPRSGDEQGVPYADSFDVSAVTVLLRRGPRAGARLTNAAPHAAAVEWGNRSTRGRGHRVLGRTLAAMFDADGD